MTRTPVGITASAVTDRAASSAARPVRRDRRHSAPVTAAITHRLTWYGISLAARALGDFRRNQTAHRLLAWSPTSTGTPKTGGLWTRGRPSADEAGAARQEERQLGEQDEDQEAHQQRQHVGPVRAE